MKDFKDALVEFFEAHMIKRRTYFMENMPDLLYVAGGLTRGYELSTTHKAMIRHSLRSTRKQLLEILKIDDMEECVAGIINTCCFNHATVADELGVYANWVTKAAEKRAVVHHDDLIWFRQEAEWIIEDIEKLLKM